MYTFVLSTFIFQITEVASYLSANSLDANGIFPMALPLTIAYTYRQCETFILVVYFRNSIGYILTLADSSFTASYLRTYTTTLGLVN